MSRPLDQKTSLTSSSDKITEGEINILEANKKAYEEVIKLSDLAKRRRLFAQLKNFLSASSNTTLTENDLLSFQKELESDSILKVFNEIIDNSLHNLSGEELSKQKLELLALQEKFEAQFLSEGYEEGLKKSQITRQQQVASDILTFLADDSNKTGLSANTIEKMDASAKNLELALSKKFAEEYEIATKKENEKKAATPAEATPTQDVKKTAEKPKEEAYETAIEAAKASAAVAAVAALAVTFPIGAVILAAGLMYWYSKKNADKREEREGKADQREEAEFQKFLEDEKKMEKELEKEMEQTLNKVKPGQMEQAKALKDAMTNPEAEKARTAALASLPKEGSSETVDATKTEDETPPAPAPVVAPVENAAAAPVVAPIAAPAETVTPEPVNASVTTIDMTSTEVNEQLAANAQQDLLTSAALVNNAAQTLQGNGQVGAGVATWSSEIYDVPSAPANALTGNAVDTPTVALISTDSQAPAQAIPSSTAATDEEKSSVAITTFTRENATLGNTVEEAAPKRTNVQAIIKRLNQPGSGSRGGGR